MRNWIVIGIVAGLAAMVLSLLYLIHIQEADTEALALSTPVLYLLASLALISVPTVAWLQRDPDLSKVELGTRQQGVVKRFNTVAWLQRDPDLSNVELGTRQQGVVKWFNPNKGFGFIEQDGGQDFFVHQSEIRHNGFRYLNKDERVEFEASVGHKGPSAKNVVRLDGYEPIAEDDQVPQAS